LPAVACEVGLMPHQPQEISKSILEKFRNYGPFSYAAVSCTFYRLRCLRYFIDDRVRACVRACTEAEVGEWCEAICAVVLGNRNQRATK